MQKITPFLWFNGNAEEAMNLYVSIFKNSRVLSITRYADAGPGPLGDRNPETSQRVMTAMLQMDKIDLNSLQQAYAAA